MLPFNHSALEPGRHEGARRRRSGMTCAIDSPRAPSRGCRRRSRQAPGSGAPARPPRTAPVRARPHRPGPRLGDERERFGPLQRGALPRRIVRRLALRAEAIRSNRLIDSEHGSRGRRWRGRFPRHTICEFESQSASHAKMPRVFNTLQHRVISLRTREGGRACMAGP
jgi:hypothetical protein